MSTRELDGDRLNVNNALGGNEIPSVSNGQTRTAGTVRSDAHLNGQAADRGTLVAWGCWESLTAGELEGWSSIRAP